jgi:hypothetical protein
MKAAAASINAEHVTSKRAACKVVFGGNFIQVSQSPSGLQNLTSDLTLKQSLKIVQLSTCRLLPLRQCVFIQGILQTTLAAR